MDPSASATATWLQSAADAGQIHTVRVSFADRLGAWRGKRMPVEEFLRRAPVTVGFCDGMIVCDVQCDVIEQTPFSNYATGYPDLHLHVTAADARPAAWAPGEAYVFGVPTSMNGKPLPVAPVNVLSGVLQRLSELGARVSAHAWLSGAFVPESSRSSAPAPRQRLGSEPGHQLLDGLYGSGVPATELSPGLDAGSFTIGFAISSPAELAEGLVVAKGAAKEIAPRWGMSAIFLTRRPGARLNATLRVELHTEGLPPPTVPVLESLVQDARPLLFPSVNAFRAVPVRPTVRPAGDTAATVGIAASSEADPATVIAVALGAVAASADGCGIAVSGRQPSATLADAGSMRKAGWLSDWLGAEFIDNSIPLLEREESLFRAAVTDWEINRYWSAS